MDFFKISLEDKIDVYFDCFFGDLIKDESIFIKPYETQIKYLMFELLDSIYFNKDMNAMRSSHELYLNPQKLRSKFGNITKIWDIDWNWIFHHIFLDYRNVMLSLNLLELKKTNVYKFLLTDKYYDVYEDMYLEDRITREPKIFNLEQLISNGHSIMPNHHLKVPCVGIQLHEFNNENYDIAELTFLIDGLEWDNLKKRFMFGKTLRKVFRTSKFIITVGDKRYEV